MPFWNLKELIWCPIFGHQVVFLLKIAYFRRILLFCGQNFWPQLHHREWNVQNLHIPHSPLKPYFCKSRLQNRHFLNCASGTCTNERIGLAEPVAFCDQLHWTFKYSLTVRHLSEPVGKPDNLKCNFCTLNGDGQLEVTFCDFKNRHNNNVIFCH